MKLFLKNDMKSMIVLKLVAKERYHLLYTLFVKISKQYFCFNLVKLFEVERRGNL